MVTEPIKPHSWIPQTKLVPPQVGDDILPRPELLKELHGAIQGHRLTLLTAPAGSGKTVTAASLPKAFPDLPVAWLALDAEDDDPVTFLWLLAAAVQQRFPDCGGTAMALLAELQNPAAETQRVLGVLINEVLTHDPPTFALVIDDFHLVQDAAIHAGLTYLLEHLPSPWRVVIASRRDPPLPRARLRARGQMAAFDLDDLHFQVEEVRALFRERLSLPLPESTLDALQERTEGWIAGLRLLASTLQAIDRDEHRRTFLDQFAAADRQVFELLAEEVLARQPADLQQFLLETSILRELTPGLCQAVTEREDAARLLEEAVRRNLFLSSVGEFETALSPTFRYHDLFAEFLRHQLSATYGQRVRELHRRAAAAETTPARVVRHYLAAEEWGRAAEAIEAYGPEMVTEGHVLRLRRWILSLPEDFRAGRPGLNYLLGMCYGEVGDFVQAAPHLHKALQGFREAGDEDGETAALVALAYHAIGRHDFEPATGYLQQILERPLSPYERVRAHINRAWLMLYQDDWAQVDADASKAMQLALSSRDPGAINVLAHQLTTPLVLGEGGIEPIERYHRTVLDGVGPSAPVVRAGTMAVLSQLQWLRGDLEAAVANAREARTLSRQLGGLVWMDMGWDSVLLSDALVREDYAAHERRWRERVPVYENTGARQWLIVYLYLHGRVLSMQARWEDLRELAGRARTTEIDFEPPESFIARGMFAALLALNAKDYEQAEKVLLEALVGQKRARHVRIFFDVRFLLAHLYLAWGRPGDALATLGPALHASAEAGAPGLVLQEGPFVMPLLELAVEHDVHADFAREVLDLFASSQAIRPIAIPGTGETLTPREVEVLQLLMTGASNKEIAEELVFTTRTAKAHVSSILRKLDVSSRTEAVARAHELSLLPG